MPSWSIFPDSTPPSASFSALEAALIIPLRLRLSGCAGYQQFQSVAHTLEAQVLQADIASCMSC
jgi:hypothetical protein